MFHRPTDARIRAAAFEWLRGLTSELGDVLATIPSGPYDDGFRAGGVLDHRHRGEDPSRLIHVPATWTSSSTCPRERRSSISWGWSKQGCAVSILDRG